MLDHLRANHDVERFTLQIFQDAIIRRQTFETGGWTGSTCHFDSFFAKIDTDNFTAKGE